MSQSEYTNSDFRFDSTWSNYSRCLILNHYNYYLLRYRDIPMCATYATNDTWQTLMPLHGYRLK